MHMEFLFELRTLMKKKVLRINFYIESPINLWIRQDVRFRGNFGLKAVFFF